MKHCNGTAGSGFCLVILGEWLDIIPVDQVLPCADYARRRDACVHVPPLPTPAPPTLTTPNHRKYEDRKPPGCLPSPSPPPPLLPPPETTIHQLADEHTWGFCLSPWEEMTSAITSSAVRGTIAHLKLKSRGEQMFTRLCSSCKQVTLIWVPNSQTTQDRKLQWRKSWGAEKVPHTFVLLFPVK